MNLHVLKSQANEVFRAITGAGLNPSNFEWKETEGYYSGRPASRLALTGSQYYFEFDNSKAFCSKWSPGAEKVSDFDTDDSC
ncbi:MAG: hypothetical protein DMF71_18895 [Acidobacteria bacterium]|nr:MAG: hypothetical protein DMF71_18895 [Acidobacteriota bacterium]